jgi:hypothetical protein
MRSLVSLAAVIVFANPLIASAQTRLEFGPLLAYYRPFGAFDPASVFSTALPRTPQDLSGVAWGGVARAWFGTRIGAEFGGLIAGGTIPSQPTPAGPTRPIGTRVGVVTVQGLLTLTGAPTGRQAWVSAGAGVIRHGGDAYARYGNPADTGLAIGAGARVPIAARLDATFGVSTLVYMIDVPMPPELSLNPGSLQRGRQVDTFFHLGATWMFGRREH